MKRGCSEATYMFILWVWVMLIKLLFWIWHSYVDDNSGLYWNWIGFITLVCCSKSVMDVCTSYSCELHIVFTVALLIQLASGGFMIMLSVVLLVSYMNSASFHCPLSKYFGMIVSIRHPAALNLTFWNWDVLGLLRLLSKQSAGWYMVAELPLLK